jgi:integrase
MKRQHFSLYNINRFRERGKHGQALPDPTVVGLSYLKLGDKIYARWRGVNKATGQREVHSLGPMPTTRELLQRAKDQGKEGHHALVLAEEVLEEVRSRARMLRRGAKLGQLPVAEASPEAPASATKKHTIGDLVDAYLRHAEPQLRAKSVRDAKNRVKRIIRPLLGARPVETITVAELQELHTSLAATPYEANRVRALLSVMFKRAVDWGWRADNPVQKIKPFAEISREKRLSEEQLAQLIAVLKAQPNKIAARALLLLTYTGARKSEVLGAAWDQFDLDAGTWTKPSHHTKQKKLHHIPLNSDALVLLNQMRKESRGTGYLFPGKVRGKPLADIKSFWATFSKVAGFEGYRVHDLRHSYASILVSKGVSLPIVGELLGHTQAKTTQRYAHLATADLAEAGEIFTAAIRNPKKAVRHAPARRAS